MLMLVQRQKKYSVHHAANPNHIQSAALLTAYNSNNNFSGRNHSSKDLSATAWYKTRERRNIQHNSKQ